jgi:uncharacterized protein
VTVSRDRDALGRALNARPRDALGRPLPRTSTAGAERVPDRLEVSIDEAIDLAQHYLDAGQPFHAHEVFESVWKTGDRVERDLWQGLAQIAVGATHAMRGNTVGAATLLRRGAARISTYVGDAHGIDTVGVASWAEGVAGRLSRPVSQLPAEALADGSSAAAELAFPRLRLP